MKSTSLDRLKLIQAARPVLVVLPNTPESRATAAWERTREIRIRLWLKLQRRGPRGTPVPRSLSFCKQNWLPKEAYL